MNAARPVAAFAAMVLCVATGRAAEPVHLHAARPADLARVMLAAYMPGTLKRGQIERQTPGLRVPLSQFDLAVATGDDTGCGDGIAPEAALAMPEPLPDDAGDAAEIEVSSCLFQAALTVTSGSDTDSLVAACGDWHDDASECWTQDNASGFTLRRVAGQAAGFMLVPLRTDTREMPTASLSPPSVLPRVPASRDSRGLYLGTRFDDEDLSVMDRWLLLSEPMASLMLER
jgi:hypothetical protein